MLKVAIYGKGGIGNLPSHPSGGSICHDGKKVIQIGCDPKADSTMNLLGGEPLRPVMNYMREEDEEPEKLEDIAKEGFGNVLCIETGGPTPGLGCAGRGIIATFQLLEDLKLFETYKRCGSVRCTWRRSLRWIRSADPGRLCREGPDRDIRGEDGTLCGGQHFQSSEELRRQKLCKSIRNCTESQKCGK